MFNCDAKIVLFFIFAIGWIIFSFLLYPNLVKPEPNKGKKCHCVVELLTERYKKSIVYTLLIYDRLITTESLPEISYAQGMTGYMYGKGQCFIAFPNPISSYKFP